MNATPDLFWGHSTQDVHAFLDSLRTYFAVKGTAAVRWPVVLNAFLRGEAKQSHEEAVAAGGEIEDAVQNSTNPSADEVYEIHEQWMKGRFHDAIRQQSYHDQLMNMRQGMTESPADFDRRIMYLLQLAGASTEIQGIVFKKGVHEDIQKHLRIYYSRDGHRDRVEAAQSYWSATYPELSQRPIAIRELQPEYKASPYEQAERSFHLPDTSMNGITQAMERMTIHLQDLDRRMTQPTYEKSQSNWNYKNGGGYQPPTPQQERDTSYWHNFKPPGQSLPERTAPKPCAHCGGPHWNNDCPEMKSFKEFQESQKKGGSDKTVRFQANVISEPDEMYPATRGRPRNAKTPYPKQPPTQKTPEEREEEWNNEVERLIEQEQQQGQNEEMQDAPAKRPRRQRVYDVDIGDRILDVTVPMTLREVLNVSPKAKQQVTRAVSGQKPRYEEKAAINAATEKRVITSAYADALINGRIAETVIDTGAARSMMAKSFADRIGWEIEEPADSIYITADGKEVTPLGKFLDVPVKFGEVTVTVDMSVSDADTYDVILGNDWLRKAKATIDVNAEKMMIMAKGIKQRVNLSMGRGVRPDMEEEEEEENQPWSSFAIFTPGRRTTPKQRQTKQYQEWWYTRLLEGYAPSGTCPCGPYGVRMFCSEHLNDCLGCLVELAKRRAKKNAEEEERKKNEPTQKEPEPSIGSWDVDPEWSQPANEWANNSWETDVEKAVADPISTWHQPPAYDATITPQTHGWPMPEPRQEVYALQTDTKKGLYLRRVPQKKEDMTREMDVRPPKYTPRREETPVIKYQKIHPDAKPPTRKTNGAAAFDFVAVETTYIPSRERALVSPGFNIEIPDGYCLMIHGRSGFALQGILVHNGIVDFDYRGEPMAIIWNISDRLLVIKPGDRYAQARIVKIQDAWFEEVEKLSNTDRGTKGFGSTGINIVGHKVTDLDHHEEEEERLAYKTGELDDKQKQQLQDLLEEYKDITAVKHEDLQRTPSATCTIPTGTHNPIRQSPYRTAAIYDDWISEEIRKMKKAGIIQRSIGPWASPIVIASKKGAKPGEFAPRLCIDYRKLNAVTTKDASPLPRMDDLFDTIGQATWFSSLDLFSGYHQIPIAHEDIPKTAFVTKYGHYEFLRMPFGLCNAPAIFQNAMNVMFQDLIGKGVTVYLDDINIYTKTWERHLQVLKQVLQKIRDEGYYIKPRKCHFGTHTMEYLGYVVEGTGIKVNPRLVQDVIKFPTPTNPTDVRSFLGLTGFYRRFIKNYATLSKPLRELTTKDAAFEWGKPQEKAFRILQNKICTAPILVRPDMSKRFYLATDACKFGLGAVLSQHDDEGREVVVAYASRSTIGTEQHYDATKLECLAAVWATKHFRHYLLGREFALITDHWALKWLFNHPNPDGLLARWCMKMQEYNIKIIHRPGKKHQNADAMSRLVSKPIRNEEAFFTTLPTLGLRV